MTRTEVRGQGVGAKLPGADESGRKGLECRAEELGFHSACDGAFTGSRKRRGLRDVSGVKWQKEKAHQ